MVSKPAVGTGGKRGATSADSTSRSVAKTASPSALRQRSQPQSERKRFRTASAMLLFRKGAGSIARAATHWFAERCLRTRVVIPSQRG